MKDIGRLEDRIDNVEYYTALSLLERDAESFEIQDSNGLNRFKSGFVVDNFAGHKIGDTQHRDYKNAIDMLNSSKVRNAFDISKEPQWLREKYGRTTYGQGCLLSRRLAEAGVKFTTCYFSNVIGGRSKTDGGWDTHGFDNTRMYPIVEAYHLPITDQTLPTLIEDLDQRGMLDETLVIWMGEFGRTPKINKNASRDHWPQCYSVLLAGGGVKKGFVYGKSDKHASQPEENAVTPEDLTATIYYLLGIDPKLHIYDTQDRPLMMSSGAPIFDIIA